MVKFQIILKDDLVKWEKLTLLPENELQRQGRSIEQILICKIEKKYCSLRVVIFRMLEVLFFSDYSFQIEVFEYIKAAVLVCVNFSCNQPNNRLFF